jgi:mannose-6-phosphate isomerase-like protein (cupin superfamily)
MKGWRMILRLMAMILMSFTLFAVALSAAGDEKPHAKVVPLESAGKHGTVLLSGPPETVTMKSGLVILEPGQTVGRHSTRTHEELLVILEGKGTMMFKDGSRLEWTRIISLLPTRCRA